MDEYQKHLESEEIESEIRKNQPSSNSATKISIKEKEHYLCKECKTFHLIKIIKLNEIKIICKEKEIDSKDFLKNILNEEKLDIYQYCLLHKQLKKIGFCSECKSDLCEDCKKLNKCKNGQSHSYVDFKIKNEEISYKEKFISDFFVGKDEYKQKTNKDAFGESEKKSEQIISEKSEYLEMGGGQGIKVIQEKNLSEYLEEAVSLKSIFDIIEKSKDKMPSYRHYENIINIYHFLCDKLNLKYYSFSNNQKKIRLFGEKFIKNNINKCSVMINNELKKIEDCEFYELEDIDKDLNITVLKEDEITDMSYMFNDCEVLQFISNKGSGSEWSTNNVVDMSYMFCNCKALSSLPEFISYWDTSKVTDMSNMFNGCESLKEIKGISKWDTSKVERMYGMFYECNALENLENIMIWNTKNVANMSHMFYNCFLLNNIDLENEKSNQSNWSTEKVENMSYMFYGCESLKHLPDSMSNWKTNKVEYMMYMFYNCKSLNNLPDISKWDTKNASYMNNMFENCSSLESLPDITKWKMDSVIDIDFIFEGCTSLKAFPNLSNWNKIKFKKGKLLENYK